MAKGKGKAKGRSRSNAGPTIALGIGAVAVIGLLIFGAIQSTNQAEQQKQAAEMLKPNEYGCTSSPVTLAMEGLERVPCKSASHVRPGETVNYEMDPPTSGAHAGDWVNPGFYSEPQVKEKLVHSLEHGHVVIYYDPAKVQGDALEAVRGLARKYTGAWDGVVAVPREGSEHPLILTAWEHTLRMSQYDQAKVEQFVDAFRGRGPEKPVRPLR